MNKKGFMMAEVVVVSAIVMTIIVGFYISYNKIYSIYRTRLNYYDTTTLYRLGYYRDILIENNKMNDALTDASKKSITDIYISGNDNNIFSLPKNELPDNLSDTVYLVKLQMETDKPGSKVQKINKGSFSDKKINATYDDYISFINNSSKFSSNYLMLMERCEVKNNQKNIDDCKYAYLEIYDGNEK